MNGLEVAPPGLITNFSLATAEQCGQETPLENMLFASFYLLDFILPRMCTVTGLTAGSTARSKQHLEVVFAVLPAFKLQRGRRERTSKPPIIPMSSPGPCWVRT
uniref:G protein-coupled receptor 17 n=2 Tax=Pan TaxID=9596 RepID=A0A2I3S782_PANTR